MWADLHVHSRWSDGSQGIEELLAAARTRGLTHLSVTDHDTVDHVPELLSLAGTYGIKVVSGIEISAADRGTGDRARRKVHILGYGFEKSTAIRSLCEPVLAARNGNTLDKLGILAKEGYPLTEEVVRSENGFPPVLYKQHIMFSLVQRGYDREIYGTLYRQLFKNGGICAGDITYPDPCDAVRAVREDGGLAVLAHPGLEDVYDLVPLLADAGLDGIEFYHEGHDLSDHKKTRDLARRYGLFLTGGSDTHGTLGSLHPLGGIVAPDSLTESPLEERFV
jgi:predicted metal-dependent phosphoesterase TrpH